MIDILNDTILDIIKILPFLFIAFLIIELIEHKLSKKGHTILKESNKYGPFIGSILGIIPQCGISVIATNLYITRIITLGTLISIYLSTSDEMLPILIANKTSINIILKILLTKFIIGVIFGCIIDKIIKTKRNNNYHICQEQSCHCEKSIMKSSIIHTIKTTIFIFIITLIINTIFYYFGKEYIQNILKNKNTITIFITSIIGLIPNCGPSIIITQLYIDHILTFSTTISGLLASSGIGILILFKNNKNIKENIKIISLLYITSVITGIILEILQI